MYQKTLSRGKFLAKYHFVNFNLIVSKVNFFLGGGGEQWALIRGWALNRINTVISKTESSYCLFFPLEIVVTSLH